MAQRKRHPPAICSSVYEARVEARKGAEESERLDRREMARDTPRADRSVYTSSAFVGSRDSFQLAFC